MKPIFRFFPALFAPLLLPLSPLAAPAPRLVCDVPAFDAGPVAPSASLSHDFLLRNDGTLPLEIRNARATSSSIRLRPPSHPIPPGDSATLRADFALAGHTGPQSGTIVLTSNDPETPTAFLSFRCDVVPPPTADPALLRFGRVADPADASRTITLSADRPFTVLSATTASPHLAVEIDTSEPAPLHQLAVSVLPSLPPGPFGDTVAIELDLPVHSRLLVPLTGNWRPPAP